MFVYDSYHPLTIFTLLRIKVRSCLFKPNRNDIIAVTVIIIAIFMKVNNSPSGIRCLTNTAKSADGNSTSTHGMITFAIYSRIDNLISPLTMSNRAVYAINRIPFCEIHIYATTLYHVAIGSGNRYCFGNMA